MKVTIFELSENESRRLLLEELFRKYLSPSISVAAEVSDAERYVKLLQAAIPPAKEISLSLETLSDLHYRIYIKVYFSLNRSDYLYSSRSFIGPDLTYLFPAVSVQDRMVFVPEGLGMRLARTPHEMPSFAPFREGGVLELDFSDEGALRNAVGLVAAWVRDDFQQNLQAYAGHHDLREVSLPKIAEDLNTDVGYIQQVLKGDEFAFERASYRSVACTIEPDRCSPGRWTKVQLRVENRSDVDLPNLLVQISGPVKIRPERIQVTVAAGETKEVPVAIRPDEPGEFPIEITFVLPEDRPFVGLVPYHHVWLTCD